MNDPEIKNPEPETDARSPQQKAADTRKAKAKAAADSVRSETSGVERKTTNKQRRCKITSGNFGFAENMRFHHRYILPHEHTLEDLKDPLYWGPAAARLTATDRLEIVAADFAFIADAIVVTANKDAASVQILATHNIQHDEALPLDKFYLDFGGPVGKHRIVRKSNHTVLKDGFETRQEAERWLQMNPKEL